jgi:PBP1b-binding outer membrane lipoprotein LpoB
MKLLKSLILVVAAGLMITACGGSGATPVEVVQKFAEATVNLDFAKAKQYVVKEHQAAYDEVAARFESPEAQAQLELFKAAAKLTTIDVVEKEISEDGNTAVVTLKISGAGQSNEEDVRLIKEDGEWKINEGPEF